MMMKDMVDYPTATPESVWAILERVGVRLDSVGVRLDSVGDRLDSVGVRLDSVGVKIESLTEKQAETDRLIKENARTLTEKQAETDRIIKEVGRQLGGISANNGAAATEFFYNTLYHGNRKMFGEEFDDVFREEKRKTKKGFEDEYDILLFNGRAVCIVEVKYKADTDDAKKVLRKEKTFRANFPDDRDKKLYLALASMSFHPKTEEACEKEGIAIIKQVGDKVVINDKHVKAF
jgi:hypothetical protein